jgi:hypothetical protein
MIGELMNNQLERVWMGAIVVLIVSVSVRGAAEENNELTSEEWET